MTTRNLGVMELFRTILLPAVAVGLVADYVLFMVDASRSVLPVRPRLIVPSVAVMADCQTIQSFFEKKHVSPQTTSA